MAIDSEHREVARRLRGLEPCPFDDGEYIDCGEVEGALGLVSEDGAWYTAASVTRLADLIEPAPSCDFWDAEEQECYSIRTAQPVDRDALLELAGELDAGARMLTMHEWSNQTFAAMGHMLAREYAKNARRIRRALGVKDG